MRNRSAGARDIDRLRGLQDMQTDMVSRESCIVAQEARRTCQPTQYTTMDILDSPGGVT